METGESELYSLTHRLVAEIDGLRSLILALVRSARSSFENPSVSLPKLEPAELGFIRLVSWLFVLYFETGRVSTRFLMGKFALYGTDPHKKLEDHFRAVRSLRTLFQHHLELTNPEDADTRETCYRWCAEHCGTAVPDTDSDWRKCLTAIVLQAVEFVRSLAAVARRIEQDESKEVICSQWRLKLERYRTPIECEKLVSLIVRDIGRDYLDVGLFTKRNHQKWIRELELTSFEIDVDLALRGLIETTLLSETIPVLPITGHDIIETLGISPGKRVGELLQIARRLYQESPCTREELLTRLAKLPDGSTGN